jgi:dienelactone hydrolase
VRRRRAGLALLMALCLGAGGPFPEPESPPEALPPPPAPFQHGALAGTLTRPLGAWPQPRPAVLVLHDAAGADARSEGYVAQLAAAGFVVLDLLSHTGDSTAAAEARAVLAALPGVDAGRIGALALGLGAPAAFVPSFAAHVLLYPDCAALPAHPPSRMVFLAHGLEDALNPPGACEALAWRWQIAGAELRRRAYPGASHAWDHPSPGLLGQRVLLPLADGRRVPVTPWPELAELSASELAGFLATRLEVSR